jgi:hypothetical protein
VIDMLCTECSSLIEHHEKIQVLSAVHYNLGKTLQDVENIAALPNEAAEAEELLCDDTNLLQARPHAASMRAAPAGGPVRRLRADRAPPACCSTGV